MLQKTMNTSPKKAREEEMGEDDNQDLAPHIKKEKFKKEDHSHKKPKRYHMSHMSQKYHSTFRCYSSQKMGHIARNCPHAKYQVKEGKNKRYHSHAAKDDEHESEEGKRRLFK